MKKTIEERVDRIEKIFWVVGVIAVIFGVSGAWGYNVLQSAKTQFTDLDKKVEALQNSVDKASILVKSEIDTKKDEAISDIKKETDKAEVRLKSKASKLVSGALNKHFENRIDYSVKQGQIKNLGTYLRVKLDVTEGDIVQASFVGSVQKSQFYCMIVEDIVEDSDQEPQLSDFALKGFKAAAQVIIQKNDESWKSLAAHQVFKVLKDGELKLAVKFHNGCPEDCLPGNVIVYDATLIATKVAFGH